MRSSWFLLVLCCAGAASAQTPAAETVTPAPLAAPNATPPETAAEPDSVPVGPARPRVGVRAGGGLLDPLRPLVFVQDGVNPDVQLGAVSFAMMEIDVRLAGPLALYTGFGGGRGDLLASGVLETEGAPASPRYAARMGLAYAGLLLQPTFGRSLLQPFVKGGGVGRLLAFDLPQGMRTSVSPGFELGGGLRIGTGASTAFVEGKWLRTIFRSADLPLPLVLPVETAQDDLVLTLGVRLTR